MKTSIPLVGVAFVALSCLDVADRPSLSLTGNVNAATLTTSDTLVITRAITNSGQNDMWLNVRADAFEMFNGGGTEACDPSGILALVTPQAVRIPARQFIVDERKFAIADLPNCAAGSYSLQFVAHFRESEGANDSFTLRTSSFPFTITAPAP